MIIKTGLLFKKKLIKNGRSPFTSLPLTSCKHPENPTRSITLSLLLPPVLHVWRRSSGQDEQTRSSHVASFEGCCQEGHWRAADPQRASEGGEAGGGGGVGWVGGGGAQRSVHPSSHAHLESTWRLMHGLTPLGTFDGGAARMDFLPPRPPEPLLNN